MVQNHDRLITLLSGVLIAATGHAVLVVDQVRGFSAKALAALRFFLAHCARETALVLPLGQSTVGLLGRRAGLVRQICGVWERGCPHLLRDQARYRSRWRFSGDGRYTADAEWCRPLGVTKPRAADAKSGKPWISESCATARFISWSY
jgi:hypothetical protein